MHLTEQRPTFLVAAPGATLSEQMTNAKLFERAIQPSIIEYFAIEGLYGYRTVSLESKYTATVLIAKNGASKTTLLAALDAVLKRQFSRLAELQFSRIILKLRGSDQFFVIGSGEIAKYIAFDEFFEYEARRTKLSPFEFCRFLESFTLPITDWGNTTIGAIASHTGYDARGIAGFVERCRDILLKQILPLQITAKRLTSALEGLEVVYLPTYRRLELSMPQDSKETRGRARPFQLARSGLHSGEIGFGLGDIPERLYELNQAILVDSNQGYREISAKIIKDLLDGTFEGMVIEETKEPSKEDLKLLFSRLKESTRRHSMFDMETSPPSILRSYSRTDLDRVYQTSFSAFSLLS